MSQEQLIFPLKAMIIFLINLMWQAIAQSLYTRKMATILGL